MGSIIYAAEKSFDIGCKVVKWDEGFDFTPLNKYNKRNISFENLQNKIKQFTVHWSATYKASHVFAGLKSRGLSCNFMIDDDVGEDGFATIYQCLDIKHAGWSQGSLFNNLGPGVEIAYMPQAWQKNMYSTDLIKRWKVQNHETIVAPIHGTKLKVFLPTKAQIKSLIHLLWGFSELFPNIPANFPKNEKGYIHTTLKNPESYSGFLSHYHLTRNKIDTAGLDYKFIEEEVSLRKKFGF